MTITLRIYLWVMAGTAIILYAIFLLPPLTRGGSTLVPGVSEATLEKAVDDERAYCERGTTEVDCACFAEKSGMIIAAQGPHIQGALYADQQSLARGQATSDC